MSFHPKTKRKSAPDHARSESAKEHAKGAAAGMPAFLSPQLRLTGPTDPLETDPSAVTPADAKEVRPDFKTSLASAAQTPGKALPGVAGAEMHTGAAALTKAIQADAFAVGDHVFTAASSPAPALIAHEAMHVAQQRAAGASWISRQPAPDVPKTPAQKASEQLLIPLEVLLFHVDEREFGERMAQLTIHELKPRFSPLPEDAIRARADAAAQMTVGEQRGQAVVRQVGIVQALSDLRDAASAAGDEVPLAVHYLTQKTASDLCDHLTAVLDPTVDVADETQLNGVRTDVKNIVSLLESGQLLLESELSLTIDDLIAARTEFNQADDAESRAAVGAHIGALARRALLLNQRLVAMQAERARGATPLDDKIETMAGEIASIRYTAQTEQDAIQALGDTPELLTEQGVGVLSLINPGLVPPASAAVEPEEAFPATLDRAVGGMQADLASRIRSQTAEVKQLHAALLPATYGFDDFKRVYLRWFAFLSQEREILNPAYQFIVNLLLGDAYRLAGSPLLSGISMLTGMGVRTFWMNFAAGGPLQSVLQSGGTDFANEMSRFGPQRQEQTVSGSATSPTYAYGETMRGSRYRPDRAAEIQSRQELVSERVSATQPMRSPLFQASELDAGEEGGLLTETQMVEQQSRAINRHIAAVQARALDPGDPLLAFAPIQPGAAEGWSYLLDIRSDEDISQQPIEREQKVMPAEVAEYALAREQQSLTLQRAHRPRAASGGLIGDQGMRAGGVEKATGTASASYLSGEANPSPSPQSAELAQAIEEARKEAPPEDAKEILSGLVKELEAWLDAYFQPQNKMSYRVGGVLAIAGNEFQLAEVFKKLASPEQLEQMLEDGFQFGAVMAILGELGEVGQIAAKGISTYYAGKGGSGVLASAAGVVTFIAGASQVSSFREARAWAVAAKTAAGDFSDLYSAFVMHVGGMAGEKSVKEVLERVRKTRPTTAHQMFHTCRPLLDTPESRKVIIEATKQRIGELEAQGIREGAGHPEMDALKSFDRLLEPYKSGGRPKEGAEDAGADAPLPEIKGESEAMRTFEPGLKRTPEQFRALYERIPPELRGRVALVERPGSELPGASVRVHYLDGMLRIEVGPLAEPRNVDDHIPVVEQLRRYDGVVGRLRRLIDGYGTQAFESRMEIGKLTRIRENLRQMMADIDARCERLSSKKELAEQASEQMAILDEISSIEKQIAVHEQLLNDSGAGRGSIAAYDLRQSAGAFTDLLVQYGNTGELPTKLESAIRERGDSWEEGRAVFEKELQEAARDPKSGIDDAKAKELAGRLPKEDPALEPSKARPEPKIDELVEWGGKEFKRDDAKRETLQQYRSRLAPLRATVESSGKVGAMMQYRDLMDRLDEDFEAVGYLQKHLTTATAELRALGALRGKQRRAMYDRSVRLTPEEQQRVVTAEESSEAVKRAEALRNRIKGLETRGAARWAAYEYGDIGKLDPCFAPGTPVSTPDGFRAIESLQQGDLVMAWNWQTLAAEPRPVLSVTASATSWLVRVRAGLTDILATRGHLFWVEDTNGWCASARLFPGQTLRSTAGVTPVTSVSLEPVHSPTVSLEVDGLHNFFVGEASILVHNGPPRRTDYEDPVRRVTRIYRVVEILPENKRKIIYIGKTDQTLKERFKGHQSIKPDWKAKASTDPPSLVIEEEVQGEWTNFETAVWERHKIEYYREQGIKVKNEAEPLSEATFKRLKGQFMAC